MTPVAAPSLESPWAHWYRRVLPAYWAFVICCTHFPELRLDLGIQSSDKLAHIGAFAILAFLLWRFVETFRPRASPRRVWVIGLILAVYAAIDEYTQRFVGRGVSLFDWFAGMAGIAVVLGFLEWRRRRRVWHA